MAGCPAPDPPAGAARPSRRARVAARAAGGASSRGAPGARRERNGATNDPQPDTLLPRIAAGDDEALRTLYRDYGRLAFSLAFRIVGRQDRAEECVQEAFLRVWRHASRFDASRGSFTTWFVRIVHNLAIDTLRRERPTLYVGDLAEVEWRMDHHDPPERAVLDRLLVREAFLRLPPEQSRVLEMAYFEGFTHREIAAELEIPEGTVKSRMRLGLERLRRYLDGEGRG